MDLCFVVGENGSGKSNWLGSIAAENARGRNVLLICNTVHDKYSLPKSVLKLSNRDPESSPDKILKSSLIKIYSERAADFSKVGKVLDYCGYKQTLIVEPKKCTDGKIEKFLESIESDRSSPYGAEVIRLAQKTLHNKNLSSHILLEDLPVRSHEAMSWLISEQKLISINAIADLIIVLERKNGARVPLEYASSGELALMSMLVFVMTNIDRDTLILIDEPENSLHPQWQKDYVKKLDELVYLYNPSVVIATHAPIVISGAQADRRHNIEFYHAGLKSFMYVDSSATHSVEETLWGLFDTVSPDNNFVSEFLVKKMSLLSEGQITLREMIGHIEDLRAASYAPEQSDFFDAAIQLARQVASE